MQAFPARLPVVPAAKGTQTCACTCAYAVLHAMCSDVLWQQFCIVAGINLEQGFARSSGSDKNVCFMICLAVSRHVHEGSRQSTFDGKARCLECSCRLVVQFDKDKPGLSILCACSSYESALLVVVIH